MELKLVTKQKTRDAKTEPSDGFFFGVPIIFYVTWAFRKMCANLMSPLERCCLPEPNENQTGKCLVNTPLLKTDVHTSIRGGYGDWQLLGPKPNFPGQIGTGTFWQRPGQTGRVLVSETEGKVTFPLVGCLFHLYAEPLLHCTGFYGL